METLPLWIVLEFSIANIFLRTNPTKPLVPFYIAMLLIVSAVKVFSENVHRGAKWTAPQNPTWANINKQLEILCKWVSFCNENIISIHPDVIPAISVVLMGSFSNNQCLEVFVYISLKVKVGDKREDYNQKPQNKLWKEIHLCW